MRESKIIEEFQAEARLEGQIQAHREDILAALDSRFGQEAGAQCAPLLNRITDTKRLTALLRMALRCSRLKQFSNELEKL
jgi:hypothetical protein